MRDEGPDEIDADLVDDDEATYGCPACGEMIYEEAEQCPECGYWISAGERAEAGGRWSKVVVVVVVVLVIVAFVLAQL